MEEYRNQTLLAIAFAVGFNSKSAFNRSFKKLEDCTPREYLKRVIS
ncbi:MAG: helix-turn-helix domain-containing protein [Saprospiraceae bacterium]